MDIHSQPIENRIEWVFEIAAQHAESFSSPETWLARQRYLAMHPTAILALKCMDGRINIPITTKTPTGIIQPFRNLGGMFNLGWPHLGEVFAHHIQQVVHAGRRALVLITYHYSKGDPKRGCAGFNYDTEAARAHTREIRAQVEHTFGIGHDTVYPLVCGFETDEDALVLHGVGGGVLNLAELKPEAVPQLTQRLTSLFPDMPAQVRADLLPLLLGNLEHIADLRKTSRELNIEHREWIVCVGRGFDFLHMPNLALIIGPYSPNLADPIRRAASIIESNMRKGRIPEDGFLLLASSPFEEIGVDRARAQLKARFLTQFAAEEITRQSPELAKKMHVRTALLDWNSRRLEVI
ncbi:MAG: carboxysome shell carbonic anhydrase [Pseudomonadota bacterium]|nr:carboxysome shell carbonic anhydrase [Pseudomonadota bacterium]MDP1906401.1 carboxysome shell carbonic anhydrase [Pseudomonadota bacterium]MDP2351464.1 carboxysome shell carbonic anhydrase [Pseudomonadota bacterium]